MAANRMLRGEVKALAPYRSSYSKLDVDIDPVQNGTPHNYGTRNKPYVSQPIPFGNRSRVQIVGGTVAWGQMESALHATYTTADVVATNNGDGSMTLNGTANATNSVQLSLATRPIKNGHVYLFRLGNGITFPTGARMTLSGVNLGSGSEAIYKRTTADTNLYFRIDFSNGTVFNNWKIWPAIHDLTSLFNPTIADYAYSLEQAQAGSGIAWLKSFGFFTEDYYPYATSKLESVQTSAHVIKDANGNVVRTYPTSDVILRGITELVGNEIRYNGDTYDPDGTVTRYWGERTYQSGDASDGSTMITDGTTTVYKLTTPTTESADPFTSPFILEEGGTESWTDAGTRDFEMPVGNVSEYSDEFAITGWTGTNIYFGDVQGTADETVAVSWTSEGTVYKGILNALTGKITVTHASVDLGTMSWTKVSGTFRSSNNVMKAPSTDAYCSRYTVAADNTEDMSLSIQIFNNFPTVIIKDSVYSSLTGAEFKEVMDGVQLVYEKATPSEVSITEPTITNIRPFVWADCGDVDMALGLSPLGLSAQLSLVDPFD